MNYLQIIERALIKVCAQDQVLLANLDKLTPINHRLARAMEAEIHCELLGADYAVDLEWPGQSGFDPALAPAAAIVPSLAVHSRLDPRERPLAIECRRMQLSPKDKQRLLALCGHAGGYEQVFGLAWKPGKPGMLLYYISDGLVRVKRLRKDKLRIGRLPLN
jgi:hypothetical protein